MNQNSVSIFNEFLIKKCVSHCNVGGRVWVSFFYPIKLKFKVHSKVYDQIDIMLKVKKTIHYSDTGIALILNKNVYSSLIY